MFTCLKKILACAFFNDKLNYNGFNCSALPKRSLEQHQIKGMDWKQAKTQVERHKIEGKSGFCFTALLRLSYFDSSHFSVVDPMHNILLGTDKLMINIWKEKLIITSHDFSVIQSKVDNFVKPLDVGRIPYKISSRFSTYLRFTPFLQAMYSQF